MDVCIGFDCVLIVMNVLININKEVGCVCEYLIFVLVCVCDVMFGGGSAREILSARDAFAWCEFSVLLLMNKVFYKGGLDLMVMNKKVM